MFCSRCDTRVDVIEVNGVFICQRCGWGQHPAMISNQNHCCTETKEVYYFLIVGCGFNHPRHRHSQNLSTDTGKHIIIHTLDPDPALSPTFINFFGKEENLNLPMKYDLIYIENALLIQEPYVCKHIYTYTGNNAIFIDTSSIAWIEYRNILPEMEFNLIANIDGWPFVAYRGIIDNEMKETVLCFLNNEKIIRKHPGILKRIDYMLSKIVQL